MQSVMLTPLTLLPTPALLSVPRPSRPQQNKAKRTVQTDSESSEDKPLAKKPKKASSKDKKKERKARRADDSDSPPPKTKTKAKDKKRKRTDDSPPPASTKKDKKPVRKVGEARRATGEALTDDAGNRYIDLGANKRVVVSDFKGKTLIQIREYYNDDGQWKPGKKVRSLPFFERGPAHPACPDRSLPEQFKSASMHSARLTLSSSSPRRVSRCRSTRGTASRRPSAPCVPSPRPPLSLALQLNQCALQIDTAIDDLVG